MATPLTSIKIEPRGLHGRCKQTQGAEARDPFEVNDLAWRRDPPQRRASTHSGKVAKAAPPQMQMRGMIKKSTRYREFFSDL